MPPAGGLELLDMSSSQFSCLRTVESERKEMRRVQIFSLYFSETKPENREVLARRGIGYEERHLWLPI